MRFITHIIRNPLRLVRQLVLFGLTASALPLVQAQTAVRVSDSGDTNGMYALQMIELALGRIGGYELERIDTENYNSVRFREEVKSGNLNIMWTSSSLTMEEELLPVRIPLYKGLLGFRVLMIPAGDQHKFNHIERLEDLQKISMGQGIGWADTEILLANGMNVVQVSKYQSLFYMTDGRRFDAFPRGVHEPYNEIARHPDLELAVEDKLMLVYRMPFYLFVSKDNPQLARDLTEGLDRAIADGSFDNIFYSAPTVKDVISKVHVSNRKVFYLDNPTLPKLTPLERKELWVDPSKL